MTMYRKLLVFAVTLIAAALFAVDYGDRGSWIVCDSDAEGDFDVFYIYPTLVSSAEKPLMDPGDPATLIPALTIPEATKLFEENVISGGMIPKVECCAAALSHGVRNVVIMDGRVPHSILMELLTDEGAGTMVSRGEAAEDDRKAGWE